MSPPPADRAGGPPREDPGLPETTPEVEAIEAVELAVEESEDGGRLRRWTAIAIVVVSILAAVMAWRASVAADAAGTKEQLSEQNLLQQQELEAADEGSVIHDLGLFDRYEQHIDLAAALEHDARAAGAGAGTALAVQAQRELTLAREEQPQFEGPLPTTHADGTVSFDVAYSRRQLRLRDVDLLDLESPRELAQLAKEQHTEAVHLTGLAVLFVGALVLLTFAGLSRRVVARVVAPAGVAVAVLAVVLFLAAV
jgi:hypothetical protein